MMMNANERTEELKKFAENYLELLKGPLDGLNLTRIEDFEDFFNKQILDSIYPLDESPIFQDCLEKTNLLVDVGFGGGFPILPLAKINPDVDFLGFDARAKKAQAVDFLKNELGLRNVSVFHGRLENILIDKDCLITFKAVGKIIDCLNMISASENANVFVFFYKGPNLYELEGKDLEKILQNKKWSLIEEKSVEVPGAIGRVLLGFEKQKIKNVPRGTKVNGEEMIPISQFIKK